MAEGSANLTTWKAKRIIGDGSASTAANALLQTGTGVGDIWILGCTARDTNYGLYYEYTGTDDNDQIKFIGDGITNTVINLKTGAGRFGNYLNVYKETTTALNDGVQFRVQIKDNSVYREGSTDGVVQTTNVITAYHTHAPNNGGMNIVMYSAGNLFFGTGEAPPNMYTLKYNAASNNVLTGENLFITSDSAIYLEAGANEDLDNNKTIADRVGLQIASSGNIIPMKAEVKNDNAQNLGASDARFANIYGVNFRGDLIGNADTATALKDRTNSTLSYLNYGAAGLTASDITWLCCWNDYEVRGISKAEMANAVDNAHKWVRVAGDTMTGNLSISCSTSIANHASTPSAIYFKPHQTDNDLTYSNAYIAVYDDGDTANSGTNMVIRSGGNIIIGGGECASSIYTNAIVGNTANANISVGANAATFSETGENLILSADGAIYFLTNCNTIANRNLSYLTTAGYLYTTRTYNAVWNDYAECRNVETEEPGYCVTETSNGCMIKTTKRLQAGCKITSDTYGVCMGQTSTAKTPIAVSGRVLVYPYRSSAEYKLGAAVCSAPNGTVDIMTRDEIMMYPERIVGTVSEIPTYDIWHGGGGDGDTVIPVNGRIWIYVK